MGVFAIAKELLEVIFEEKFLVQTGLGAHISGDAGIVFSGMGVSLGREFETGPVGSLSGCAEFGKHGVVVGRVADDGDVLPVLGRAAHHRGTSDIDILDGVFHGHAFLRYGLTERIEVHANQFYGLDAVLAKRFHVLGHVASRQDTAVHLGMQSLHPSVADLRETGHFADSYGFHAFRLQQFLCSAGGYNLPTKVYQALYKRHQAALVAYTD